MLAGWLARCGGYNDGTMLAGWWARRGGYNDDTQCWQDDGNDVEVTMMTHNAGRMMETSWRLQWWHTMLAGWWAWRGGYNDGTQCWLDDGHGVEVTMMAQCWQDDGQGVEVTMMTHNAGWMMGMAWRLQWWHTILAGWWARHGGYNDGTQCWLDDWHGVEVTMIAQCWLDDGHGVTQVTMMADNAGWMMGMAWRLQWWHTMLAGWLARCGGYNDGTMLAGWWAWRGGYNDGTFTMPSVNHTTKILDPPWATIQV